MNSGTQKAPATTEDLEKRLYELARSKSRLELINRLLTSLSSVAGLDNMVQHILDILMQTIGAANISIIFRLDDAWQLRDIYGESREFKESDNPEVIAALASGKPLRVSAPAIQPPYPGTDGDKPVENWIFPLLTRERKVGAICMDGMQLTDQSIYDDLVPFFVYAGLMLDNEISNYSQLAQAHRRLQDSETLYRSLFEQSPDGLVLWSFPELKPLQFNETAHSLLGYSREEFAALTVSDLEVLHGTKGIADIAEILSSAGTANFESVHRTKNGEIRPMSISLKMFELTGRTMVLATHRDISNVKRLENELAASREFLDSIIENIPNMIFVKDAADLRFVKFNRAGEDLLGIPREELIGKNDYDFFPEHEAAAFTAVDREVLSSGRVMDIPEETIQTRSGQRILHTKKIAVSGQDGSPGFLVGISEDITGWKASEEDRKKLEQQLLHAQKLESLGVLAGGIAHDFNNILMAIIGNADLALLRISRESPAVENLQRIEQAAARAADLAKQMLAYSGKGRFVVESIDLNRLLEEMLNMLEVSISKKAILRLNLHQPLPPVEADATQMRQIVMNLVINASEAIGDRSGVIAITTGCMECDRSYLKDVWLDENITQGLYVYLEISDGGCGMDKETLGKLFDPFFTTKFTGRGLGMAAVLGIVRGHKGAIKVYSEAGKGTTFKILLPATGKPAEISGGAPHTDAWYGSGTVLLVDDEEHVRGTGSEMLKELGFSTITANDGREAVAIFKETPDIGFVILDLTMPHMDGEQCFRELRKIRPDIKVIMSSGFNEQEVTQKFAGKGLSGFIQKPYRLRELREAIKSIQEKKAES